MNSLITVLCGRLGAFTKNVDSSLNKGMRTTPIEKPILNPPFQDPDTDAVDYLGFFSSWAGQTDTL
jgi:hypothetical protein